MCTLDVQVYEGGIVRKFVPHLACRSESHERACGGSGQEFSLHVGWKYAPLFLSLLFSWKTLSSFIHHWHGGRHHVHHLCGLHHQICYLGGLKYIGGDLEDEILQGRKTGENCGYNLNWKKMVDAGLCRPQVFFGPLNRNLGTSSRFLSG